MKTDYEAIRVDAENLSRLMNKPEGFESFSWFGSVSAVVERITRQWHGPILRFSRLTKPTVGNLSPELAEPVTREQIQQRLEAIGLSVHMIDFDAHQMGWTGKKRITAVLNLDIVGREKT